MHGESALGDCCNEATLTRARPPVEISCAQPDTACRGEHYVPGAPPESGRVAGTNGETPPIAPSAAQLAQRPVLAQRLQADGWSPGLCYLAAQRI